ncbi:hypothetical protein J1C67_06675 [Clostridium gasigenes]|uniref:hypothetical protein n=1 Tax=Clostridium gasigenes TaxID=94869 RepID=UPI00143865CE|nr:hypothetical protein [Clostridium gasigenes]NKF08313.1 hypothetical protein [Clostridium gasigenes]QSW20816.1 hypothetical protein J1C67_06675 [Clostridium gasigenes]
MIYISEIFVKITSGVESIYKKNQGIGRTLDIIIQLLYSATISLITGSLLHMGTVILLISILNINYLGKNILEILIIPVFLFTMCIWIIGYNFNNKKFRFSKYMLRFYLLSNYISAKKIVWKSAIYLMIMPFILSIVPTALLILTDIGESKLGILYKIILIITFIVSLILYSEFQSDELERSKRQVGLWGIIFIVFLTLNMYQYMYALSSSVLDQQQIINMLLSIGALAFTLVTMTDKTREMYKKMMNEHSDDVSNDMIKLMNENNYTKVTKPVKEEIASFSDMINILQSKWKSGNRKELLKFIFIIIGSIAFIITMFVCSNIMDELLTYIMNSGKSFYISLFNGNKDMAVRMFVIVIAFSALIYILYRTIKKFKQFTISERINNINLIILLMIVFIGCLSIIFTEQVKQNILYMIRVLGIIFVIGCIVQAVLSKVKK